MAKKLSKDVLEELDRLVDVLTKGEPEQRAAATRRLMAFEESGRIPIGALESLADVDNPAVSMYAITALGRNGSKRATAKLIALAEKHREGNVLFLETIVDALGETRAAEAGPALLGLLGIELGGWKSKLLSRLGRRKGAPEDTARQRAREHLTLPVVRALEKVADPACCLAMEPFLEDADPFVRWHTIQALSNSKVTRFNDRLKRIAEGDSDERVREMAAIALTKLAPLPEHLNN